MARVKIMYKWFLPCALLYCSYNCLMLVDRVNFRGGMYTVFGHVVSKPQSRVVHGYDVGYSLLGLDNADM